MIDIENDAMKGFVKTLRQLDHRTFMNILEAIGKRIGLVGEENAAIYPEQIKRERPTVYQRTRADGSTYMSKFKSLKQQRKVFWLINHGKVPRKRTGRLGNSITSRVRATPAEVIVEIGTDLYYAPYVIGEPPEQALIHQNYWTPLQVSLVRATPRMIEEGERELRNAVSAYFP